MKVSLVVMTAGKSSGQSIPITLSQFVIGRDPQCNLRPASALISKRHCALIQKSGRLYVHDFNSTNGTFVNDEPIKGERPVQNGDILKLGPLEFKVVAESSVAVNKPTPIPAKAGGADDESVAAMLLSLQDESESGATSPEEVPSGSTVMEMVVPDAKKDSKPGEPKTDDKSKKSDAKAQQANTSAAAADILKKYSRRGR